MTMNFYFGREFYPYEKKFVKICEWLQKKGLIDPKKVRVRSAAARWMIDKFFDEIDYIKKKKGDK